MNDNLSRQTWLERRRAKQQAASQQTAWDMIRQQQQGTQQAVDGGANRQLHNRTVSDASARSRNPMSQGGGNIRREPKTFRVVAQPILVALLIIFTLVGGSPVINGHWSFLVLGVGLIVSTAVGISTVDILQHTVAYRKRRLGIGLGGGLLLIGLLGMVSQHVVAGRALLHGSALDRAVSERGTLDASYKVLMDNQNLLYLPAEQAASLATTYQNAAAQDLRVAKLWNPATVTEPPLPAFEEIYRLMNLAAVTQSAALNAFLSNLVTPENSIAEQARLLTEEAAQLLTVDIPKMLNTIDTIILQGNKSG